MTSIRFALGELQRLTTGRLPKVAMLALVLVPTLYGGFYLYANHDPYGNLDQVPAALVVLDTGTTDATGKIVNSGRDVADELTGEGAFDWRQVSAAAARKGVREGRYDFALTMPADFSAALSSPTRFAPERARLTVTTNDANSYLSSTIADKVSERVRHAVTVRVGTDAAEQFLIGYGQIRGSLQQAADGAGTLRDGLVEAAAGAGRIDVGAGRLDDGAGDLAAGLTTMQEATAALPAQTDRLADGARKVADGNAEVARVGAVLRGQSAAARNAYYANRVDFKLRMAALGLTPTQQEQLLAVYGQLATPVDKADAAIARGNAKLAALSAGATRVGTGARTLADRVPALTAGLAQARSGSDELASGAGKLRAGASGLDRGLGKLASGSDRLTTSLSEGAASIPVVGDAQRARLAATIGNPVAVKNTSEATAGSYGAGLAPFFMALAAWIGGYVLFLLVRPLSRRAMATNHGPFRVALAGWLAPAAIGVAQMAALLGVVTVAIGIVPQNIPGTLLFLVLISLTFVAMVHALNAWFGPAGQFLALVLMVVQLVSAGGTFPWRTLPEPLQRVHDVLPMSYAVDGVRQLMYGGLSTLALRDVLVLLAWLAAALLASTRAARVQRIWTLKRVKPELAI